MMMKRNVEGSGVWCAALTDLVAARCGWGAGEEVDIPRGERKAPLTPEQWRSFLDENGRVTNERKLRKKIFYGVRPTSRGSRGVVVEISS